MHITPTYRIIQIRFAWVFFWVFFCAKSPLNKISHFCLTKKRQKDFLKNNMPLYVFDLDDTLVRYGRKRMCVPRQTFHMLRRLQLEGHTVCVISFNPLGSMVMHTMHLNKFVARSCCSSKLDRDELLLQIGITHTTEFHYFDDRIDNLQFIKHHFPLCKTTHVSDPLLLYSLVS